jgi:hypothetical protein
MTILSIRHIILLMDMSQVVAIYQSEPILSYSHERHTYLDALMPLLSSMSETREDLSEETHYSN